MPAKRPQFINGEIYHVILRGIAGQKVFLERKDYLRYLLSLNIFNDKEPVGSLFRNVFIQENTIPLSILNGSVPNWLAKRDEPESPLIEVLTVCLMPNHIHLLVRQLVENGISLFFQKMGGYSSYFNKKYERFGSLFQRPFKAIHIRNNNQLLIVVTYIHLNPVDLVEPNWKIKGIDNPQKILEFLKTYPWSSYAHYLGKKDLSWLINSTFLKKIFEGPKGFRDFVEARISHKTELRDFLGQAQMISLE
jgi:putative transposase